MRDVEILAALDSLRADMARMEAAVMARLDSLHAALRPNQRRAEPWETVCHEQQQAIPPTTAEQAREIARAYEHLASLGLPGTAQQSAWWRRRAEDAEGSPMEEA